MFDDFEMPKEITCKVQNVYQCETGGATLMVEHEEIVEFFVPQKVMEKARPIPGDKIKVEWEGTDIGDDVENITIL